VRVLTDRELEHQGVHRDGVVLRTNRWGAPWTTGQVVSHHVVEPHPASSWRERLLGAAVAIALAFGVAGLLLAWLLEGIDRFGR
jgi:hypothetical protein